MNGTSIAYAASVYHDSCGRWIAGYTNFCPFFIERARSRAFAYPNYLGVAIHELTHALIFNSIMDNWRKPNGTRYKDLNENVIVEGKDYFNLTQCYLATPKLIEKAKQHYGCDSIDKIATDNDMKQNADNTTFVGFCKAAHWESRIINDEVMTPMSSNKVPVISDMTLAIFEVLIWLFFFIFFSIVFFCQIKSESNPRLETICLHVCVCVCVCSG